MARIGLCTLFAHIKCVVKHQPINLWSYKLINSKYDHAEANWAILDNGYVKATQLLIKSNVTVQYQIGVTGRAFGFRYESKNEKISISMINTQPIIQVHRNGQIIYDTQIRREYDICRQMNILQLINHAISKLIPDP